MQIEEFLKLHKSRLTEYTTLQKQDLRDNPPDEFSNFLDRKHYLGQLILSMAYELVPQLIREHGLDPKQTMINQFTFVNVVDYLNLGVSGALLECHKDFNSFADEIEEELFSDSKE